MQAAGPTWGPATLWAQTSANIRPRAWRDVAPDPAATFAMATRRAKRNRQYADPSLATWPGTGHFQTIWTGTATLQSTAVWTTIMRNSVRTIDVIRKVDVDCGTGFANPVSLECFSYNKRDNNTELLFSLLFFSKSANRYAGHWRSTS